MRIRSSSSESGDVINISSMIDVMFILIIFFLVTTTFKEEEIDHMVNLPVDARNQSLTQSTGSLIKINIRENGAYVLMGSQMTEEEMSKWMKTEIGKRKEAKVLIRCDRNSKHLYLANVMSICRHSGVPRANIAVNNIQVGDKILVNGPIAQHGMAIMSQREGLEFESAIESDSTNLNDLVLKLLDNFGDKIRFLRDPTRGGLASVLSEIAVDAKMGIEIFEEKLPLERQVAAACEMLGLDPLYVANEGLFAVFVDPTIEQEVLEMMHEEETGSSAAKVGEVTSSHPGQVILHSEIGGKRIVTPLIGEQLPRIC